MSFVRCVFFQLLFIFLLFIAAPPCFSQGVLSAEIHTDREKQLRSLNHQRDTAFMEDDLSSLEVVTRTISELSISARDFDSCSLDKVMHSVIKTRYFFSGKVDIFSDFYQVDPFFYDIDDFVSSDAKRMLAFIMVADTLASILFTSNSFNISNDTVLTIHKFLGKKIIEELRDDSINREIATLAQREIRDIVANQDIIFKLYNTVQSFAPIIGFKNFYNDLMVTSRYNGYEVIGIDKYVYWPTILSANERQKIQKALSQDMFLGRFKPLSLEPIRIEESALSVFPQLRGRTSSFLFYYFKLSEDFEPIEFMLISEKSSEISLNDKQRQKIKTYYSDKIDITFPNIEAKFLYYAEQNFAAAQYTYAVKLFNDMAQREDTVLDPRAVAILHDYLKRAAQKGHMKAQHNMGRIYHFGIEVEPNFRIASYWYRLAADQGCAESLRTLSCLRN